MTKLLLSLSILAFAGVAKAAILLEPHVGYEMGTLSSTTTAGVDGGGKTSAIDLGARLGWHGAGLFIAADPVLGMSGKLKPDAAGSTDSDFTRMQVYLDLGYDFPARFRIYGGYALMNELTFKGTGGSADTKLSGGTAYKAGVAYHTPWVSIGVEYHANQYKDANTGSTTVAVDSVYKKYEDNATVVTLAMPFMFR